MIRWAHAAGFLSFFDRGGLRPGHWKSLGGELMRELTTVQALDVQRRWARNRFLGDVWLIGFAIVAMFLTYPASRSWVLAFIAPVPPLALFLAALVIVWWPLSRYTHCPACRRHVSTGGRANFCPSCGVGLREHR